jgi:hypothetical protein
MLLRICFSLVCIAALPAWAQVEPTATGDTTNTEASTEMLTPPPVSGQTYPTEVGAETQSNFLRGGLTFNTSYIDNLFAGSSSVAVSETTFTILPTVSYDQVLPRQHLSFTYSSGFTFYQPNSVLNEVDQDLKASYQYLLSPHMNLSAKEGFQKSSYSYGLADSIDGGAVSGSSPTVTPGIYAPFAQRLTNTTGVEYSYQFSPVAMVGASGSLMELNYPNAAESAGLYNSDERGGGAFYNRRVSAAQYLGLNYQFSFISANPENMSSQTQIQSFDAFYSFNPKHDFSISISGGAQHYTINESVFPAMGAWGPTVTASIGWQGQHTNLDLSYTKAVTSGGGLLGAFDSNSGNALVRWQFARAWTAGASGSYASNTSVSPLLSGSTQGGHSISGQATLGRTIGKELNLNFEYDRLHQSYSGVAAISSDPNSDREMVSLAWQFTRPLGR